MSLKTHIVLVLMLISSACYSQSDKIKNKQRAILIYNFAQQVTWSNQGEFQNFTIGVLGPDAILDELRAMQNSGRTVKGNRIVVRRLTSINEIVNIQLVYVNRKFNFDMKKLLAKVRGENTLIVSEDYGFNQSMINMISIDDNFQFEINRTRLSRENLGISPSLEKMAIASAARWQELYKQSSKSLQLEKELVLQQKRLLEEQKILVEKQNLQINDQISKIDESNLRIENLRLEYDSLNLRSNGLRNRYRQDSAFQILLNLQLDSQRVEINKKQQELAKVDEELQSQRQELTERSKLIKEQDVILEKQREEIDYQKNFTLLFVLISFLTLVAGFFVWRSYRIKKKSEAGLRSKNDEIERQKKELEFQNKEMEEFAYVASHDLQAPLNSMNALVNVLLMGDINSNETEIAHRIIASTDNMRQLIKGLLEYSQLGKSVEFKQVDCNLVAKSAIDNLDRMIKDTDAIITVGDLPLIEGHEVKLILLFQNLLGNAIKFKKPDEAPQIRINVEKLDDEENKWKFEIKDNGIGIVPEAKDKIFAIFQRLHSTDEYEGTGIGLAHCKKIVDLHGGNIWVESEEGKGSSFFFTL